MQGLMDLGPLTEAEQGEQEQLEEVAPSPHRSLPNLCSWMERNQTLHRDLRGSSRDRMCRKSRGSNRLRMKALLLSDEYIRTRHELDQASAPGMETIIVSAYLHSLPLLPSSDVT